MVGQWSMRVNSTDILDDSSSSGDSTAQVIPWQPRVHMQAWDSRSTVEPQGQVWWWRWVKEAAVEAEERGVASQSLRAGIHCGRTA